MTIENLLAEREDFGTGKNKQSRPVYQLSQLLDANFHPPAPEKQRNLSLAQAAADSHKLVKVWGKPKGQEGLQSAA